MMPKSGQMTLPPKFFSMIYGKLLALHLSAYRTTPYTIYRMNHRKFTILSVARVVNRNHQRFVFLRVGHICHIYRHLVQISIFTILHGGVESTVIERRQQQLGRMADFPPHVTFSVFDL